MGLRLHLHKVADKTGERPICHECGGAGIVPGPRKCPECDGSGLGPWPLAYVELLEDPPKTHEFPERFLLSAELDGWLERKGDVLEFKTRPKKLRYRITKKPNKDDPNYQVELAK